MNDQNDIALHKIFIAKKILSQTLFTDPEVQNRFDFLLRSELHAIRSSYDEKKFSYVIKLRKKHMRSLPGYAPEVSFYYPIIGNIIKTLLTEFKDKVINGFILYSAQILELYDKNENYVWNVPYKLYYELMNSNIAITNLVNIQCISDNELEIVI